MNCGRGGEEVGRQDSSAGVASAWRARAQRTHLLLALARRLERDRGGLGAAEVGERVVGAAPLKVDLRAARGRVRRAPGERRAAAARLEAARHGPRAEGERRGALAWLEAAHGPRARPNVRVTRAHLLPQPIDLCGELRVLCRCRDHRGRLPGWRTGYRDCICRNRESDRKRASPRAARHGCS